MTKNLLYQMDPFWSILSKVTIKGPFFVKVCKTLHFTVMWLLLLTILCSVVAFSRVGNRRHLNFIFSLLTVKGRASVVKPTEISHVAKNQQRREKFLSELICIFLFPTFLCMGIQARTIVIDESTKLSRRSQEIKQSAVNPFLNAQEK